MVYYKYGVLLLMVAKKKIISKVLVLLGNSLSVTRYHTCHTFAIPGVLHL